MIVHVGKTGVLVRKSKTALRMLYDRLWRLQRDIRLDWVLGRQAVLLRREIELARRAFRPKPDPLVTVLIPTYNRGKLLIEWTLSSVLEQTYQNIEVIVVGDHCTDDTEERIACINDRRIRFHNLPVRGEGIYPDDPVLLWRVAGSVPAIRLFEMARGDWIVRLDDDTIIVPGFIEILLEFALDGDYELVFGKHRYAIALGEWREGGGPTFPTGRPPYGGAGVPNSAVMYRSYLKTISVYTRERYRDSWTYGLPLDNLTWQRMGRVGIRAGFLDRVLNVNPLRPGEAMRTLEAARLAGHARAGARG
ncbi:MAG: glycosyltransferase family 2 protein [Ardenticatenaceae bacterium]|nr:glycosyltransferase family 2 protein [Ardenticatenaceae bacterium]